jgi:hypothetical protein
MPRRRKCRIHNDLRRQEGLFQVVTTCQGQAGERRQRASSLQLALPPVATRNGLACLPLGCAILTHKFCYRAKNKLNNMTPGFWRLARRERGAYPHGSVTSEQRRQPPKEQVRLFKLFCGGSLARSFRPRATPPLAPLALLALLAIFVQNPRPKVGGGPPFRPAGNKATPISNLRGQRKGLRGGRASRIATLHPINRSCTSHFQAPEPKGKQPGGRPWQSHTRDWRCRPAALV